VGAITSESVESVNRWKASLPRKVHVPRN